LEYHGDDHPISTQSPSRTRNAVIRKAYPISTILLTIAVVLPAVVACWILFLRAPFAPFMDDYDAFFRFAADYQSSPSVWAKFLQVVLHQHNEYKLIFEHIIVAFEMELTGHLDFRFLMILGDLFLLPIGYLLWRTYGADEKELNQRLLRFLPISLLFFSLIYCEALDFAMAGLQTMPVIFFGLLSIRLLTAKPVAQLDWIRLLASLCAAALALSSSGNGLLLLPLGVLFLLSNRAYARMIAWCVGSALIIAVYFCRYTPAIPHAAKNANLIRPIFFLGFLGCAIPLRWPAALLGLVLLAIVVRAALVRFERTNPVSAYLAVWILMTAALVAWDRGAKTFWVASRYSVYSILLLIVCYDFIVERLPRAFTAENRRRVWVTCSIAALCYCMAADMFANKHLRARQRMIISGIEAYRANPAVNSPVLDPQIDKDYPGQAEFQRRALTMAIEKHIYVLPPKQESLWKGEF
jgi:uncharacterized membrane protein